MTLCHRMSDDRPRLTRSLRGSNNVCVCVREREEWGLCGKASYDNKPRSRLLTILSFYLSEYKTLENDSHCICIALSIQMVWMLQWLFKLWSSSWVVSFRLSKRTVRVCILKTSHLVVLPWLSPALCITYLVLESCLVMMSSRHSQFIDDQIFDLSIFFSFHSGFQSYSSQKGQWRSLGQNPSFQWKDRRGL